MMKDENSLAGASSGGPKKILMISGMLALAILGFFVWHFVLGKVPVADVRLVDSRVTFKFTAYKDYEEYFVSCSVVNKIDRKVRVEIAVELGEVVLAGAFNKIQTERTSVELQPLELKPVVVKFNIPKSKDGGERDIVPRAKITGVAKI